MPIPRLAVIDEVAETRVACQVARAQGDGAPGRVANEVGAERSDDADAIGVSPVAANIAGEQGVLQDGGRASTTAEGSAMGYGRDEPYDLVVDERAINEE